MSWARVAAPYFLVLGIVVGIAQGAYTLGFLDRLLGRSQPQQPYHNCVLQNMRGVTSDVAARAVIEACANKDVEIPPETLVSVIMDVTQIVRDIGGESWLGSGNMLNLRLHHNTPSVYLGHAFISYGPPGRQREFRCDRGNGDGGPGRTSDYHCGVLTQDVITNNATWRINRLMGFRQ